MTFILRRVLFLLLSSALSGPMLPAAEPGAKPRVVKIRAGVDNVMKFDVATIAATAGETIQVVLANASTLPKDVMGHNWVLLAVGTDVAAFAAAAAPEAANGYIPPKMKDKVIAHTAVLGPNETGTVTLKVPSAPGEYPFLCSFPGHGIIGMKGVLVVKK